MTVMREDVHQRAGEQHDEWQDFEDMRTVFPQQKVQADGADAAQCD